MTDDQVTVVVVPRERFSLARRSLESIYEHTRMPFSLVYVDGNSPAPIRRYLDQAAREKNFRLVRTEHYLSPNRARNLGLREVKTKYVAFVDNDVLATPGWLENLVACAEETGAWVVGPLYLEGEVEEQQIHMAGGTLEIREEKGRRVVYEKHRFAGKPLTDPRVSLRREPCQVIEFHTLLVRTEVFGRIAQFDEGMLSTREQVDFCLAVREAGGSIYFEPAAVVSYVPPPPLAPSDLPFYMLRWGEVWGLESLRHFGEKWGIEIEPHQMSWLRGHRRLYLSPLRKYTSRVFGARADRVERKFLYPVERRLNRLLVRPSRATDKDSSERAPATHG